MKRSDRFQHRVEYLEFFCEDFIHLCISDFPEGRGGARFSTTTGAGWHDAKFGNAALGNPVTVAASTALGIQPIYSKKLSTVMVRALKCALPLPGIQQS